jgi:hypothetical protein
MAAIRNRLIASGSSVDVSEVVITEGATIELRERQIRFEMREFFALAQGRGLSHLRGIEYLRDRASANPATRMINIGLHGDLAEAQTVLWHEMAHMIEFEDPSIANAAKSWIRARATGPEQTINSIQGVSYYEDDEVALPGKFIDPYIGKIYDMDATEVISMGLQHFTDPEKMLEFYRKDPERYLRHKCWEDEVIAANQQSGAFYAGGGLDEKSRLMHEAIARKYAGHNDDHSSSY